MTTKVLNGLDLGGQRIQSVSDPSSAQDAATKAYVDNIAAGLRWKQSVLVASTADITIATLNNGDSIDGVTVATNDRVLLKDQSDPIENGIYIIGATNGTTARANDADSTSEVQSATVMVEEGSTHGDTGWTQTEDDVVVDTDAQ